MALYAFDGTWNVDDEDDGRDTNVVRFCELYAGSTVYRAGVGTRWKAVGKLLGGVFGIGGRQRIEEMLGELRDHWRLGDDVVDVVGFSRGAALAVHFANLLADEGLEVDGQRIHPRIRFLGLWDVVGSFGLSFDTFVNFQEINLGWNITTVAANVDCCRHAMALDERRETFGVTRLDPQHRHAAKIAELWFRGVHSDVGGGNENPQRSNIALQWMLGEARACGLPIKEELARSEKYAAVDVRAPISENRDPARDPRRSELPGDARHPTAEPSELQPGEEQTVRVYSRSRYNWTGIRVVAGGEYRFSVAAGDVWEDGSIVCGPEGWKSATLPWHSASAASAMEKHRRVPGADWFQLCGALDDEESDLFAIVAGGAATPVARGADLYLFANDLPSKYGNNEGFLDVTIRRTA